MSNTGWIGVDLDGTLAVYTKWCGPAEIGDPIPRMLDRVRGWVRDGKNVRIFTARAFPLGYIPKSYSPDWSPQTYEQAIAKQAVEAIRDWCLKHIGVHLPITCVKDYSMYELWDDRAVQVERNTGRRMDNEPEGETTP
jgi:hypothetical protein